MLSYREGSAWLGKKKTSKTRNAGVDREDFEACSGEHRRLRHRHRGVAEFVGVFESGSTGSTTGSKTDRTTAIQEKRESKASISLDTGLGSASVATTKGWGVTERSIERMCGDSRSCSFCHVLPPALDTTVPLRDIASTLEAQRTLRITWRDPIASARSCSAGARGAAKTRPCTTPYPVFLVRWLLKKAPWLSSLKGQFQI
jgi:hypothetical protein